jgi:hypothetical protein
MSSATANISICRINVVNNGIHYAHYTFPLIKQFLMKKWWEQPIA